MGFYMMTRFLILPLLMMPVVSLASAETVKLLPEKIQLTHKGDFQRIVLEAFEDELAVGDLTGKAQFTSTDESVVTIDEHHIVHAVGNGKASVKAVIDGKTVGTEVQVNNSETSYQWNFSIDVQPALTKIGCNAGACHGAAAGKNGFKLSLRGYDHQTDYNVMTRQVNGRRVMPETPEDSLILQKPSGKIPHGGGRLMRDTSPEYVMIKEWIEQGAKPPSKEDKKVVRIESIPSNVRLTIDAQQQFIVLAYYDDGSVKDVTRWVKYETTEDGVAVINQDGLAGMKGSGSAAMTMWFASKVTFSTVSVPYPEEVSENVFANAPRYNYIDDKIYEQLQALNLPPSAQAGDLPFVRRVYIDAIGMLPSQDEVTRFLLDPAADKRAKLIDRLLQRSEFVDLWSYKWSDLLLVSQQQLKSNEAMWAFYRYIRQSVEENKPWDRFVQDIITAQGSNLENGAGNYYLIHKETSDLTETTSQAFLGMSVKCAHCHNHPLEKWTQDQYYQFANLFARVKLKNGDRAGETYVMSSSFGEVLHPLRNVAMNPAPLDGEEIALDSEVNRRQHLANWLTSKENPYFSRAIINRVWKHYMGQGLVEPVDDLRLTNPPVNEALFAALEADFEEHDFDLKHLMRTIMNSAAYQRSSEPNEVNINDETHFPRFMIRRIPAETLLDAYSFVLNAPSRFPGYPEDWRALQLPDSQVASYFLDAFGRPERVITCECERQETPTLPQSLHMANGATLNNKLRQEGNIIDEFLDSNMTLRDMIIETFLRAYSRAPREDELSNLTMLAQEDKPWDDMNRTEKRTALEDIFWALLASKEFLFNK